MRVVGPTIFFTITGFIYGFISMAAAFAIGFGGKDGSIFRILLLQPLLLPEYLTELTMMILGRILIANTIITGIWFFGPLLYGVLILFVFKEVVVFFRRKLIKK